MEGQKRQNNINRSSSDHRIEIEDHVDELEYLLYLHEPGSKEVADAYTGYAVLLGDYPLSKRGILEVKTHLEDAFNRALDICDRSFMTAVQNKGDYWDKLPSRYINGNHMRSRVTSYNIALPSNDRKATFLLHVSPLNAIFHSEAGLFDEYSSVRSAHETISIFGMNNSETYVKPYAVIGSLKSPSPISLARELQDTRNNDAQAWNVVQNYCDYLDIKTVMIPPDLKKYN